MPADLSRPPRAKKVPQTQSLHGVGRDDPYAWLKDEKWQQVMHDPAVLDPAIRAHLEAENAYTKSVMAPVTTLTERLFAEMKARIKEDDSSVPKNDGPFAYYQRTVTGGQHPVFCRHRRAPGADGSGDPGAEDVLLDGNLEADGLDFFKVAACRHSPDHRRLAYAVDSNGSEYHEIRVKDLESGALLPDRLRDAQGEVVWSADGAFLFYTVLDANHRPSKVFRHRLGSDSDTDTLVYEEPDPGFFVNLGESESGRLVIISAHDHTTSEVRLIDAARPEAPARLVAARESGMQYDVSEYWLSEYEASGAADGAGGRLLIRTNADGAIDFKIVEAPLEAPERANWRDWRAHEEGRLILELLAFKDFVVHLERVAGLPRIVVTRCADGEVHEIAFEEEAYDLDIVPGFEFDSTTLRFAYSSMTTPLRVYDYDMATRERVLRKEREVPSGHVPADYVTRRIFAPAGDGTQVPVSLLYRKGTPLDGSAPCLLYGYGSYGLSMPASFSTNRLSLVDRGFVYAIAHIRGGMEGGYRWYLDGKLMRKKNTFSDFIAAAEALIAESYTSAGHIVAQGGSAGGMLMGAVVNLRPELFHAIVAEVPFVDVLNTMCDADLPLTPPEWPEWGNPIESRAAYDYIASYSPYDNIEAKAYPAILATAGLTDPRVTYWEPAKWVARLRELKTDAQPLLLKTNMTAGHAGAAGRFDKLEEVAFNYAFALMISQRADAA